MALLGLVLVVVGLLFAIPTCCTSLLVSLIGVWMLVEATGARRRGGARIVGGGRGPQGSAPRGLDGWQE